MNAGGHARDSDAIAGDNAQIFRIVGTNGSQSTPNAYLTFLYDNYAGSLRIIPRAIQLLDYTQGGPASKPRRRRSTAARPTRSTARAATTSSTA